jgi:hypothetical protein
LIFSGAVTIEHVHRYAFEAWGGLGGVVVERWREFNAVFFDEFLRPIPVVISPTLPKLERSAAAKAAPAAVRRSVHEASRIVRRPKQKSYDDNSPH